MMRNKGSNLTYQYSNHMYTILHVIHLPPPPAPAINSPSFRIPSVPSMGPGATQFIRTPCGPHSTAKWRVSASMAALAEPAWV